MTEPKTLQHKFATPPTPSSTLRDAWLVRSEAVLRAFEAQLDGAQGIALGFIVMASDYLWAEQKGAADYAKLDARGFVVHCGELLASDDTLRVFIRTMVTFYEYLVKTQQVEPHVAPAITLALRSAASEITRPQDYYFR